MLIISVLVRSFDWLCTKFEFLILSSLLALMPHHAYDTSAYGIILKLAPLILPVLKITVQ